MADRPKNTILRRIKKRIMIWALKDLWNAFTEDDVLIVDGKNVIMRGEVVSAEVKQEIISGAKAFLNFPFWHLLTREMKIAANKKLYYESMSDDDMIFPKAILWTVDVMQKKAENLSRLQ